MPLNRSSFYALIFILTWAVANPAWPDRRLPYSFDADYLSRSSSVLVERDTPVYIQSGNFFNLPSLSQKRSSDVPLTDPSLGTRSYEYQSGPGEGMAIYTVDTGFELVNQWETFRVPVTEEDWIIPETVPPGHDRLRNDPVGHGTCVASLMTGERYGVAKEAALVIVKLPLIERDRNRKLMPSFTENQRAYAENMIQALEGIKNDIAHHELDEQRTAIINLSISIKQDVMDIWGSDVQQKIFQLMKDLDSVAHIVAASDNVRVGSDEEHSINSYPGLWHQQLPNMVIVGAADKNGNRFSGPLALPERRGLWAIGLDIECATPNAQGHAVWSGSSQAAPIVSGLLAYLKASPDNNLPGHEKSYQEYASALLDDVSDGSWVRPGSGLHAVPLVSNQPLDC